MFPHADVPVVQLSINALQPLEHHLDLGARPASLRTHAALIVGSGNAVHHLRRIDWTSPDAAADWHRRFADAAPPLPIESPGDVHRRTTHASFDTSLHTPHHYT